MKNKLIKIINADLIGYTLGEARKTLEDGGMTIISIKATAPPKHRTSEYDDSFRVVSFKLTEDGNITLLVCKPL